jgi:antitoxin (DNA-binding transcriptional repressor) of toxin-antitoxin stability system
MYQIELNGAKPEITTLIEAAIRGEEVIITKDEQPIAKLVLVKTKKSSRKAGSAKGMIKMSEDFNEPLADFSEYM